MPIRPVSTERLVQILTKRITDLAPPTTDGQARWARVGLDGAPGSEAGPIAAALVVAVRATGRPAVRVDADDFWRPASLRLERGRYDVESFYENWYDVRALAREVLDPLEPGGTGRVLPTLWDRERDRATRAPYHELPPGGVLILHGPVLLGTGLRFDLTVHFVQSPAALARHLPEALAWTAPAYQRYHDEVDPASLADVVVRCDDPRHPALVEPD